MYRPEGYEELRQQIVIRCEGCEKHVDVMLEALKTTGFHIAIGHVLEIEGVKIVATKNQTLVLIPDDIT